MERTKAILIWVAAFFVGFALTASPAFADAINDAAQAVVEAVKSGHYTEAVILGLVVAVAGFRKYGGAKWPFWAGDIGGSLLVLIGAFGTTLAASLTAGAGLSLDLLWSSFKLAAAASGGYTLVKRLGGWAIAKLPIPGWAESALSALLWLFQPRGAEAIAKADKAGEDAVRDDPGTGSGPTGTL